VPVLRWSSVRGATVQTGNGVICSVCVWSIAGERWHLDMVATSVEYRGRRFASRLIARLIQAAREANAVWLHAEVDVRNQRMQSLLRDVFGWALYPDLESERVFAVLRLR
jgi:ribosomal protein S18 acetylase RimI-like enzyme